MKILFIAHSASLSGAPLVMLNLVKWIKYNEPGILVDLLLFEGGDYENEYKEKFNEIYYLKDFHSAGFIEKIKRKVNFTHQSTILKKIKKKSTT